MITNKICRITNCSFLIIELVASTSDNFDSVTKKLIFSYTFSSKDTYQTPYCDCGVRIPIPIILPTGKTLGMISEVVDSVLRHHFEKLLHRKLKNCVSEIEKKQIRSFYNATKESLAYSCTHFNNLTLLHRALSWPEEMIKEYYNELANLL
jgi:hypothetical protein